MQVAGRFEDLSQPVDAVSDSSFNEEPSQSKEKHVDFCTSLRVVLIPSRGEYKKAGLYGELWWAAVDFMQFQASANSEIRMLASYEGIGAKAARNKLYQPGPDSLDPEEFLAFVGASSYSSSPINTSPAVSPYSSVQDLTQCSVGYSGDNSPRRLPGSVSVISSRDSKAGMPILCSNPRNSLNTPSSHSTSTSSLSESQLNTNSASQQTQVLPISVPSAVQIIPLQQNNQDEMFGYYDIKEDESDENVFKQELLVGALPDEQSGSVGDRSSEESATTPLLSPESSPIQGSYLSKRKGKKVIKVVDGQAVEQESNNDDDDTAAGGKFPRVSSLDCVKSALRVPLPEWDADDGLWTWDGKLKSGGSLYQRTSSRKSPSSPSSSKQLGGESPRSAPVQNLDNFWTLVAAFEKPNGLDGVRKNRFQSRHLTGGVDASMNLLSLTLWAASFVVVVYVAWSWTAEPPHDPA